MAGAPRQTLAERIERDFTYHPPKPNQVPKYEQVRAQAMTLASIMAIQAPESRELSLAITKLEEAVMWFNAAVARNT